MCTDLLKRFNLKDLRGYGAPHNAKPFNGNVRRAPHDTFFKSC